MSDRAITHRINDDGARAGKHESKRPEDFSAESFHDETAAAPHVSAHQDSMRDFISSRTSRVRSSFSSGVPVNDEGSGKPQCRRVATPGKMGQRSALVSSQTVIT